VSLTQALVADSLTDADRDAAFSLYYFIGFISGPIWGLLTGVIMETAGFSVAFSVLGFSYLAGMLLMFLVEDPRSRRHPALEQS
jgi:dipeptide/tripeptide permease